MEIKADLISRATLLKDLSYCAPELWYDEEYIKAKIMKQHAVDAAPVVHGRWESITHGFPPEPTTVCSNCGLDIDYEISKRIKADSFSYTSIRPSYCPHCGAKMDGEGRE